MSPGPEESALINWHDPEGLRSAGGEAEATTFVGHFNKSGPSTPKIEYDKSGRFKTDHNASALTAKLGFVDANWQREKRYHVEVDPVTANLPARWPDDLTISSSSG